MRLEVDVDEGTVPDGSLAVFVNPKGEIAAICKVDKGVCTDVTKQGLGTHDPAEEHTEFELEISIVPAENGKVQTVDSTKARICRDKLGNIVKCPPR